MKNDLYALTDSTASLSFSFLSEEFPQGLNGYVYVVNSECSVCIGNFLSFAKHLVVTNFQDTLVAIICESTRPIINHYLKEEGLDKKLRIRLVENESKRIGIKEMDIETGKVYKILQNNVVNTYLHLPAH